MIGVRQSGEYIATYAPPVLRRISWPAVGAGVGVALLIQLVLSIHGHLHQWLMGAGVGIGTMDPTRLKTLVTADLGDIPGLCWRSLGFFFFSSRRRHTRLTCDWSSDVCSSD